MNAVSRDGAISRAKIWLENFSPSTREAKALRDLGLLFCKRIQFGLGLRGRGGAASLRLPAVAAFVTMNRERTHAVCRSISLASSHARRMGSKRQQVWNEIMGGMALSYARAGDPPTVAALLRASAQLGLKHTWLHEAERFLLDQQTPEGCFGLFARELALVGSDKAPRMAHLQLSVEILWALAEAASLHATHYTNKHTHHPGQIASAIIRIPTNDAVHTSVRTQDMTTHAAC